MKQIRSKILYLIVIAVVVGAMFGALIIFTQQNSNQPKYPTQPADQSKQKNITFGNSKTVLRYDRGDIWAGYIVKKQTFTKVEGKIIVPHISCTQQSDVFSAWVGFDGSGGGPNVEQAGITSACMAVAGHTVNEYGVDIYAWWMMYGAGGADIFKLSVKEGDTIHYSVAFEKGQYIMTVENLTTGETGSHSAACEQAGGYAFDGTPTPTQCTQGSVEWIVERAGNGSLAKFETTKLYDNTATIADGTSHPIGYFYNELWNMSDSKGGVLTNVSDLLPDDTFYIKWLAGGYT